MPSFKCLILLDLDPANCQVFRQSVKNCQNIRHTKHLQPLRFKGLRRWHDQCNVLDISDIRRATRKDEIMIKRLYGRDEQTTAAKLAKEILMDALDLATCWEESSIADISSMTDKEKEKVNIQLNKKIERLKKILGN